MPGDPFFFGCSEPLMDSWDPGVNGPWWNPKAKPLGLFYDFSFRALFTTSLFRCAQKGASARRLFCQNSEASK
ncbi:MAG: hypothetical protein HQL86_07910 [Magnetococcales bacterium]|nr:hypothetical protein [Magnetococcales bacterium]